MSKPGFARCAGSIAWMMLLAACSNGRGSLEEPQSPPSSSPPPTAPAQLDFSVGGTVTGLAGSGLVLQNNGASDLPISSDGVFTFTGMLTSGTAYDIKVVAQPSSPAQICTVANGSGTVATANVTNIVVSCSTAPRYFIGGTVSGLAGSGLVLRNNDADDLPVSMDGNFTFATPLADASSYNVVVATQPQNPTQQCTLANGSGTVVSADVTNVALTCTTLSFKVRGTVQGLAATAGLVLRLNGANDLPIASDGAFEFPSALVSGTTYDVTVLSSPTAPLQVCSVTGSLGTIRDRDVQDVRVTCATQTFAIGGSVTGLLGQGLTLLNQADTLQVESDGGFQFPTQLASGTNYNVSVSTHPSNPTQACTVANGSGTVTTAAVGNVAVTCSTTSFPINVDVQGLAGTGLTLTNNGGDALAINANGAFNFSAPILSGAGYDVQVAQHPITPSQTCSVTNGSGTVTNTPVATSVQCVTNDYLITVQVTGLVGAGLVLQNNGGEQLAIATDGSHSFPTALPSGSSYFVTVFRHPLSPRQLCGVVNPAGVVTSADVTNIEVRCESLWPPF